MNFLRAIIVAVLAAALAPAARAGQKSSQAPAAPVAPAAPAGTGLNGHPLQSVGKVGGRPYGWRNGWAWMALGDDAKVSMIVGIEQGIVFSVRENWNAMPKEAQQTLVGTAERLTVGGVSFNQIVLEVDEFYLDSGNDRIPVVDAYLYVVLEEKKTPDSQLKKFLERLRKTYAPPPSTMKPMGKP
ncbi:MAG TPA: hypothetical protein VNJ52_09635 [Patescibacteria group bacterium]|nr:hypothetical protein [Patescibacteria group bacterium]